MKAKRVRELAGPIDRLLSVCPTHPQVVELAGTVRDQLCQQAKKKLEQNDYQAVQELLDSVPTAAVDETVDALRASLAQRNSLLRHLNNATVVSRNHVAAAKWLASVSGSEEAKRLFKQAQEAWTNAKQEPLAEWRASPKRTAIGCPVGWRLYPHVESAEVCKTAFTEQPGLWFVATGLALQAIGLSRHSIDFTPKGKAGLGGLLKREKPTNSVWGIDVGTHSVKAVRLTRTGNTIFVNDVHQAPRPIGQSDEELVQLLSCLRDQHHWQESTVAVALSARFGNIRTTPLPPLDGKKLAPILQREAEALFPIDSGDIEWRCNVGELPNDGGKFGVFSAAKKSVIHRELTRWNALGINPKVLTVDALAARNGWAWQNEDADGSHGLLDIGASNAVFSLEDRGRLWVRVLSGAGQQVTDIVTKELKVTQDQAEQIKEDFGKASDMRPLFDGVREAMHTLQAEVRRTLEGISREDKNMQCNSVTCIGGGTLMTGLIDTLRAG